MDAKSIIQEEKLQNILRPDRINSSFKITLRFQKFLSQKFDKALALARENPGFLEEGEGDFYKVYVSFYPRDVEKLYQLFELVKDREDTKIYLNNKQIPYAQDLWLFLVWFYKIP